VNLHRLAVQSNCGSASEHAVSPAVPPMGAARALHREMPAFKL
jgi:hypothetical protein